MQTKKLNQDQLSEKDSEAPGAAQSQTQDEASMRNPIVYNDAGVGGDKVNGEDDEDDLEDDDLEDDELEDEEPALDEEDLEENDLTEEDADNVEWNDKEE